MVEEFRTKPKHVWDAVGFDCENFQPNIWRCPYCETFRSVGKTGKQRINQGQAIEYTDVDGGLIQPVESKAVPPCIPKLLPPKDRPVKGIEHGS